MRLARSVSAQSARTKVSGNCTFNSPISLARSCSLLSASCRSIIGSSANLGPAARLRRGENDMDVIRFSSRLFFEPFFSSKVLSTLARSSVPAGLRGRKVSLLCLRFEVDGLLGAESLVGERHSRLPLGDFAAALPALSLEDFFGFLENSDEALGW
jgi:hypothetical protein